MPAFPKYPRYKPSGVEWLGDVPEHWEIRRNLGVFDERKEANQPNAELLSVTQDRGIIKQSEITAKKDSSNDDKSKYKVVRVGDLAYNKMRAWQGALGVSQFDGIVSPAYVVLIPRNPKLAKFFHYLYRTPSFITEANRLSYGLCDDMNSLRYEHFKTSYSPLPPDDEIDRIVAFLDEKTAEIDRLIAKKQRQIELLDEQKAILINRAVTRGIRNGELGIVNEEAPEPHSQFNIQNSQFTDSGIPWIGPIPKHWELSVLKRQGRLKGGIGFPHDEQGKLGEELHFYKVGDLSASSDGVNMAQSPNMISRKVARRLGAEVFPPSTIVYAKIGAALLLNRRRITREPCCIDNNMTAFVPNRELNPMWAHLWMTQLDFSKLVNPGPVPSLSEGRQGALPFLVPPRNEQDEIVRHLNELSEQFNTLSRCIESQIQTLQTLRSTLIAHAVTGKIKV